MKGPRDEMREQREAWNFVATNWEKWDDFIMDDYRPIGERILELAALKEEYVVLDFATGTGEPGLSAARMVKRGKVIGADISEDMLRIAEKKARKQGIENYFTRLLDSPMLPFEDDSFDAVISRFGVMFFPDVLNGLKEMVRVLKPGRRLVLSVWGPQDDRAKVAQGILTRELHMSPPGKDVPGPFRCSEGGAIGTILRKAGLTDVREVELKGRRTWDSPEHYWRFLQEANPTMARAIRLANKADRKTARRKLIEALRLVEGDNHEVVFDSVARIDSGVKSG